MKTPISSKAPLLIVLVLLSLSSFAQQKVKFGKIGIEDLQMKRYDADTTAHAVILYDKGYFEANSSTFTRHLRLKVITAAGMGYTNFQVRTPSKSLIDGVTYNLVNGAIAETPLENENIFKEEIVEGLSIYKIFFPSVKPGCVIDLKYTFTGLPSEWRFQERIPVKYNEITLEPTTYITFKKTIFGRQPIDNKGMKWTATNMPAFLEEPYMCHYSNYLTHFKFDLETVNIPGFYRDFSASWQSVGKRLMEDKYFGHVLTNSPFLNEKASELKKSTDPILEKIRVAYQYIQENIKWNGVSNEFVSDQHWTNFKKNHSGNAAEVNMSLITLLNKAGIKAYPVVLSTRENGLLNPASASMSSLNYVIGLVRIDGQDLLLDATEPELIPGMLPVRCRNISAFVIDPPNGQWIETDSGKANVRRQFINIQQNSEGHFIAEVSNLHEDYDYLEWIKKFRDHGSEEAYVQAVIAKTTDAEVKACTVSIDKEKMKASEKRIVDLTGTEYVQHLGNEIVIDPFIFSDVTNPFKEELRNYPVDFVYPLTRSITIILKIPENYSLRKKPDPLVIRPGDGGAKFSFLSNATNDMLTIRCTLQIERQIFTESEYLPLRNFFVEVNRKILEAIQLDKKA